MDFDSTTATHLGRAGAVRTHKSSSSSTMWLPSLHARVCSRGACRRREAEGHLAGDAVSLKDTSLVTP